MPVNPNDKPEPDQDTVAGDAHSQVAPASDTAITSDVPCLKCGYNLRGLTTDRVRLSHQNRSGTGRTPAMSSTGDAVI